MSQFLCVCTRGGPDYVAAFLFLSVCLSLSWDRCKHAISFKYNGDFASQGGSRGLGGGLGRGLGLCPAFFLCCLSLEETGKGGETLKDAGTPPSYPQLLWLCTCVLASTLGRSLLCVWDGTPTNRVANPVTLSPSSPWPFRTLFPYRK